MKQHFAILSLFLVLSCVAYAQRPHLEVGGTLGFKDEFHYTPQFDTSSNFTEFHIYDLFVFTRLSKKRIGGEFGVGFEKAANYFIRRYDNSTDANYMNLNRVLIDFSPYVYLVKKPKTKWDMQLGLRNYFNLNSSIAIPNEHNLKIWKLAGRLSTNYIFKSFIIGLYYEHDIRSDYYFKPSNATFGLRCGVIY